VESDDIVDPTDAAIQALLAAIAQNTDDDDKRDRLIGYILTIPPLTEWPPDCREKLRETCEFVISLRHPSIDLVGMTRSPSAMRNCDCPKHLWKCHHLMKTFWEWRDQQLPDGTVNRPGHTLGLPV
jgi:hypothetical protein